MRPWALCSIGTAVLLGACILVRPSEDSPEHASARAAGPVLTLGHGTFVDSRGEAVEPDVAFVLEAQAHAVRHLREHLTRDPETSEAVLADLDVYRALIDDHVTDPVLSNALYVDWLLERSRPRDASHVAMVNHALRWHYVLELEPNPFLPRGDEGWWKGLDRKTGEELERFGIAVFALTHAGGPEYKNECRDAGVPVPEQVFSADWVNRGTFEQEFLSSGLEAELWMWESDDPPGVCLALPRWKVNDQGQEVASVLGVICLGTQTSKACFFDNPNTVEFPRHQVLDFDDFIGGAQLDTNGQGTCTDCHAGENPFVVHPDKPAFQGLTAQLRPLDWHDPIVVASWPQNPGPTSLLSAVPSPGRCDGCHTQSYAGRFPKVSDQLKGWCSTVLGNATGPLPKRTMPPGGADPDLFAAHVKALEKACGRPGSDVGVVVAVDQNEDPEFLSPPRVLDPVYACAELVGVAGAVLDAEVELFADGSLAGSFAPARDPDRVEFQVAPLAVGQELRARQVVAGVASAMSAPVVVRDHTLDYPAGLPAPQIDPDLVYECAELIAVRHVPTAVVTVYSNGADPVRGTSSTGWTAFRPAEHPFDVGDTFTAEISICDELSPLSPPVSAVPAPSSLPPAQLDPVELYDGQELVKVVHLTNGSRTTIVESNTGTILEFTTPISWHPNVDVATPLGRPLTSADSLRPNQELCSLRSEGTSSNGRRCPDLPAPEIERPGPGDTFVVVSESIPGARVRVYDAAGKEIGDGSGSVVVLSRPLQPGETLTVVQQVGECVGRYGFRIDVFDPETGD